MKNSSFIPQTIGLLCAAVVIFFAFQFGGDEPRSLETRVEESGTDYETLFSKENQILGMGNFAIPTSENPEAQFVELLTKNNEAVSQDAKVFSKKGLSEKEIFDLQHPERYIDYLGTIEDIMIQDGALAEGGRRVFDSEEKVFSFWRDTAFPFLKDKGVFEEVDRDRLEEGIAAVRAIHLEESAELRAAAKKVPLAAPFIALFDALSDGLVKSAQAQTCFMSGVSPPTPGINLIAPCCACNVAGVPIGCLNLLCLGRPAIYDQTLFICGCGL